MAYDGCKGHVVVQLKPNHGGVHEVPHQGLQVLGAPPSSLLILFLHSATLVAWPPTHQFDDSSICLFLVIIYFQATAARGKTLYYNTLAWSKDVFFTYQHCARSADRVCLHVLLAPLSLSLSIYLSHFPPLCLVWRFSLSLSLSASVSLAHFGVCSGSWLPSSCVRPCLRASACMCVCVCAESCSIGLQTESWSLMQGFRSADRHTHTR